MDTIVLTNKEPDFTITGREEKMSVEILKVSLKESGNEKLILNVTDENGFLIYSKQLLPEPIHPNALPESLYPEVAVNKRFIFSRFLKINIECPPESPFAVEVHFV